MTHFIAIEGVIGVGKTSLARRLQPLFNAKLLLEQFEENPFLPQFYADKERNAFQTQIFFLLSRYHQQKEGVRQLATDHLIADYTFAKDELFAWLNLRDDELTMYGKVHSALAEKLPKPDLVVFLHASPPVLMRRIALRDRPYERDMDPDYIRQVAEAYENWLPQLDDVPLLVVETDDVDFLSDDLDVQLIHEQIVKKLEQPLTSSSDENGEMPALIPQLPAESNTTLQSLQQFHQKLDQFKNFNPDLFINYIHLTEEVGEVAAILAKIEWETRKLQENGASTPLPKSISKFKNDLGEELADVLAYTVKLANYAGINLNQAYHTKMKQNINRTWQHTQVTPNTKS